MEPIEKPWSKPGYTGKLKNTPLLPGQPGFVAPDLSSAQKREILFTGLADGDFDIDLFNKWIALIAKQND